MPADLAYEIFQWQLASLRGCGILAVARRTSVFVKHVLTTTFALVAFAATAFNSEQWLEERSDDSDMVRLRVAYRDCVSKIESPAENVSFPLETFPDGSVKSRLTGRLARMAGRAGPVAVPIAAAERRGSGIVRRHRRPRRRRWRRHTSCWGVPPRTPTT